MPDRRLRILQVMRAPVGGLFRHVADLTRALDDMGHEVGLVVDSLASDAQTEARLQALLPYAKLGIFRFPMPRLFGAGDLKTPLGVLSLAGKLNIDILHGHGAKGGFYARLARIGRKQSTAFYTPHGGVLHFSARSRSGQMFHRLERWLMAQTGAIIFESAFAEKTYSALIGAPTCRTEIIHNGLTAPEFIRVEPVATPADFVFVGELRQLKGIFTLVEALKDLKRPDGEPVRLVMAGDGPDRQKLEAKIAALGLTDRVSLVGSKPARDVFALGRIAVVPSLAESLPYVVLEAAAAQLPVIASNVGGIPEIFGELAPRLVTAGDTLPLAAAMQHALNEPETMQIEMRQLLGRIGEQFSLERMAGDIEALYRAAARTA